MMRLFAGLLVMSAAVWGKIGEEREWVSNGGRLLKGELQEFAMRFGAKGTPFKCVHLPKVEHSGINWKMAHDEDVFGGFSRRSWSEDVWDKQKRRPGGPSFSNREKDS